MHIHLWTQPVELRTYLGDLRRITSTEEAAKFLIMNWPLTARGHPMGAQQRFVMAIRNAISVEDARSIFIEACMSIGMQVIEDD
ncbi:DUF982 domain-containing protein [Labrys neptuniae]|uniref:DUF982 domain-containing protein n=1 Tax=Labrys neptuniae TaxID=376174 RepID=A0ABV3PFU0_9HYPH